MAADDDRLDALLLGLDHNAAEGTLDAAPQRHTLRGKSRGGHGAQALQDFQRVQQGIGSLSARLRQAGEADQQQPPEAGGGQDSCECTSCGSGASEGTRVDTAMR